MPKATFLDRVVQISAIILAVLYLFTGLAYLYLDYWSVTQQDFWRVYHNCLNQSWWQTILNKFNGHSLIFPSFIWLAEIRFFHGNQAVLFYASFFLLAASTALLLWPIWRDRSLDLTTRILATLTIVAVSFWMGRASITVSGGFNCMNSFVMLGFAWALLLLPKVGALPPGWRLTLLLICAGYVASFSFGTGLAIWPCLLLLGWSIRLAWRSLGAVAAGGAGAGLIFHFLPPRVSGSPLLPAGSSLGAIGLEFLSDFCRLLGTPIFYCVTTWRGVQITSTPNEASSVLLWSGVIGLLLAGAITLVCLVRRDLRNKTLIVTGLGLVVFDLFSLLLIVAGRLAYFREEPGQVAAPRYIFWSSLFWAGLLLVALGVAQRHRWMRWPSTALILIAPILGWPFHREEGIHWRYSRLLTEEAATALINGVDDPDRILFREKAQIDLVAPELRARRLDMFAPGFQDWIGQPASTLFPDGAKRTRFRANARGESFFKEVAQKSVLRVVGNVNPGRHKAAATMVILNPDGVIVGVARSFATSNFLNALLFANRMSHAPLRGYIREYHPGVRYVLRAVDRGQLSEEEIEIVPPTPGN